MTNKVVGPIAKVVPFLAVIHHVGRISGRDYTTPVNAFPYQDRYIIALTYGRDADWAKNVLATGDGRLTHEPPFLGRLSRTIRLERHENGSRHFG